MDATLKSRPIWVLVILLIGTMLIATPATAQFIQDPFIQTDLTISSLILPSSTTQGAEFGSQTKVTVYNQGTTIIEGGFVLEIVVSSDRLAPIEVATPTTTFIEDGLLPNGRIVMPTMQPESTLTLTFPGMTMVTDAPLDELIFICAVVDPEHKVDENWRHWPLGIGVNKLCMPLDVVGGPNVTTPIEPPVVDPPAEIEPPTRTINAITDLASFDSDEDCRLSDTEFFALLDGWLDGSAAEQAFFDGIDAWLGQSNICAASQSQSELRVLQSQNRLVIAARNATALNVEIFDQAGRRVFAQNSISNQLIWNLQDLNHKAVANGVYFVSVMQNTYQGVEHTLKKIVVLR